MNKKTADIFLAVFFVYYAWAYQEKRKGTNWISEIGGTTYAGWGFNFDDGEFPSGWYKDGETLETYRRYNPAEAKAEIIDKNINILKTKPFFLAEPAELFDYQKKEF